MYACFNNLLLHIDDFVAVRCCDIDWIGQIASQKIRMTRRRWIYGISPRSSQRHHPAGKPKHFPSRDPAHNNYRDTVFNWYWFAVLLKLFVFPVLICFDLGRKNVGDTRIIQFVRVSTATDGEAWGGRKHLKEQKITSFSFRSVTTSLRQILIEINRAGMCWHSFHCANENNLGTVTAPMAVDHKWRT